MPRSSVVVDFIDREFHMSHARAPRGYGSWAFEIVNGSRSIGPVPVFFPSSTYADAKRACVARVREACAAFGLSHVAVTLNVCP
jgi:hypothetical protein